jgi:hypothetical protein
MRVIGKGQVLSPLRDSRDSGLPFKLRRDKIDEHISGPAPDANGDESRHWQRVDGGLSETGRPVGDHPGASFGCAEQSESPDEHEPTGNP